MARPYEGPKGVPGIKKNWGSAPLTQKAKAILGTIWLNQGGKSIRFWVNVLPRATHFWAVVPGGLNKCEPRTGAFRQQGGAAGEVCVCGGVAA